MGKDGREATGGPLLCVIVVDCRASKAIIPTHAHTPGPQELFQRICHARDKRSRAMKNGITARNSGRSRATASHKCSTTKLSSRVGHALLLLPFLITVVSAQ